MRARLTIGLIALGSFTGLWPMDVTAQSPVKTTSVVHQRAMRVVSLSPSNTELIYAIGAGDLLAGRTIHCDYPKAAQSVTAIGSLFPADYEKILARKPTLVVMSDGNVKVRDRLKALGVKVLVIHPRRVSDIAASMRTLGKALGRGPQAAQHADEFKRALLRWSVRGQTREKVLYEVWHTPLMIPGKETYLADLIKHAGGQPIGETLSGQWPRINTEYAISSNPTLILTKNTQRQSAYLGQDSPWRHVTAVVKRRVFTIPNEAHFVRPGPRVIHAIRWLRSIIETQSVDRPKP